MTDLELWGGLECTLNRVQDTYFDQCQLNGHETRISDLEIFKNLGLRKIRYPFLWEKIERSPREFDWTKSDAVLRRFEDLGLEPIVGLLHHGSGPAWTSLVDPHFPQLFSDFAEQFAQRYPHLRLYTPINEPLTTARFSCLYGIWYPHLSSDADFVRALVQQMKASVLAMRAIRQVNPEAQLIQTEDLGRAQATNDLQYQARFENERRWLSYDFLTGRVHAEHPLFRYLSQFGFQKSEQDWFLENDCPPQVIGLNHYLLSNRFLDDKIELYPPSFHGGNGRHCYADVGAVDTSRAELPTPESVFQEAWDRYHLPLAVTEVHLNGPREAQMQWFYEIYQTAQKLRREKNIPFQAVTAWSLLGSYDWTNLCTLGLGHYEPGVFDLRNPQKQPRPTALAHLIRDLNKKETDSLHPLLECQGWWKTDRRCLFGEKKNQNLENKTSLGIVGSELLITGGTGTLGRAFARACEQRGIPYRLLRRSDLDIADPDQIRRVFSEIRPWALINTAGYVRVDEAESDWSKCFRENVLGPAHLAEVCSEFKIPWVTFSSDLVFDGQATQPYVESSMVCPLNAYGRSKAESEKRVLNIDPNALIIRTSSFFGPWDEANFLTQALKTLIQGKRVPAVSNVTVSPTYVPDLTHVCLDLLLDRERGILHLTNQGEISWSEFAKKALSLAQARVHFPLQAEILEQSLEEMKWQASRPLYSVLSSERISPLPHLDDALGRYLDQLEERIWPGALLSSTA